MLETINLTVTYKGQGTRTEAVRGISFNLRSGAVTGLVGESGSGKSTVISAILGLLSKNAELSGEILFDERDLTRITSEDIRRVRWREISLVPQSAQNSFTPVLSIGRHIAEVLLVHMKMSGGAADRRIDELLEQVGLESRIKKRYPHELSGGQKQRAAIAAALACSPRLLLADEPTTALDVITQAGILELLASLRRDSGLGVLLVSHDLPMAASVCDELIVMYKGEIVERGTPDELISNPEHFHTRALVNSAL